MRITKTSSQRPLSRSAEERRWKFVTLSQGQARQCTFEAAYLLISVQDPDEPRIEFPTSPHCRGILRLQFDDIERAHDGQTLFTRAQAWAILDFVFAHKDDVTVIACHCKRGICRSPAILSALAEVMGQDAGFLRDARGRPKYRPNRYVHAMLRQEGRRHALSMW